jgi:uncharacterized alpha-E superfamily protein
MLARVAETLYWSARYLERAENLSRLISINNMLMMDLPKGVSAGWRPLIDIVGSVAVYSDTYQDFNDRNVLSFLTIDEENPSSLYMCVKSARNNLRTVREVIPNHVWQLVNSLYHYIQDNRSKCIDKRDMFGFFEYVTNAILTISGALHATLNHDEGYIFMCYGMYLERADMSSRILDVRTASLIHEGDEKPYENLQWISVLRSMSAYQMYRQKMGMRIRAKEVLTFILTNIHFPRSVQFCLSSLSRLGDLLSMDPALKARIGYCQERLQGNVVAELHGEELHAFIDALQIDLSDIHQLLCDQFFIPNTLEIEQKQVQIMQA